MLKKTETTLRSKSYLELDYDMTSATSEMVSKLLDDMFEAKEIVS